MFLYQEFRDRHRQTAYCRYNWIRQQSVTTDISETDVSSEDDDDNNGRTTSERRHHHIARRHRHYDHELRVIDLENVDQLSHGENVSTSSWRPSSATSCAAENRSIRSEDAANLQQQSIHHNEQQWQQGTSQEAEATSRWVHSLPRPSAVDSNWSWRKRSRSRWSIRALEVC